MTNSRRYAALRFALGTSLFVGFAAPADAATYKLLYPFQGGNVADGGWIGPLTYHNGTLYGTAEISGSVGVGTLFSITPSGTFTRLWSFQSQSSSDGAYPDSVLLNVGGALYGETWVGGTGTGGSCNGGNPPAGWGTVFKYDLKTGVEKVLHSFMHNGKDGLCPGNFTFTGLINLNDTLYDVTPYGGGTGAGGTLFSITTGGKEKPLYPFPQTAFPEASPLNFKGTFYATTNDDGPSSCGTVYSFDPATGVEKVLYSFQGAPDACFPSGQLVEVNGKLYGTSQAGGTKNRGTVFSFDLKTNLPNVLHSFVGSANTNDGIVPMSGVISVRGTLYGTTIQGGLQSNGCAYGCGTVFSVNPTTGKEKLLYEFQGGTGDGALPWAGLTNVDGTLYGTTWVGGPGQGCGWYGLAGCGTVYSVTP